MKFLLAFIAAMIFAASPALSQTPASGSQQQPPQRQPGASAPSAGAAVDAPPLSLEKPDPAKDAAVRHLMEITQTNKMGDNISAAITNQVRQVMGSRLQPDKLTQFMSAFSQKMNASAPSSAVTDAVVPIYGRHFTTEDIQGLIQFYESPLGRKVVAAMPQVTQESETAGIQIDQKAAMNILRGMQDDYPELKQMLPPEGGAPGQPGGAPAPPTPPGASQSPAPGGPSPSPRVAPGTPQK